MASQYEVFPLRGGKGWSWRFNDEGKKSSVVSGDTYDSRAEAITAAQESCGDKVVELFLEDGSSFGSQRVRGSYPVVLLRLDGSTVGQIGWTADPALEGSD